MRSANQPLPSSVDLVDALVHGDARAEAALYERFSDRVFYVALRTLRVREDAEDVRAETFVRVLHALRQGRLREAQALPGFVLETARNVVRERLRERARTDSLDDAAAARVLPAIDPPMVDPYRSRAIEQLLGELRPRDRAFLRMCYYDELSKAEMSRRLGVSVERLRLVKSRALKRFRELYAKHEVSAS